MDHVRARYAAKRGVILATAFLVIGVGGWLLRPATSPNWSIVFGAPLIIGLIHTFFTHLKLGTSDTSR